jgi:putative OPT family oligopeptide transporter
MSAQAAPQLSIRAIALSIVLAMILAAANTYLGLFAGLTIASAIPAAVASMAVLHAFGGGHILENNIVQTGASAAASIAAGVIFTIPALVIIGYWPDFEYGWVLSIAGLGGISLSLCTCCRHYPGAAAGLDFAHPPIRISLPRKDQRTRETSRAYVVKPR